MGNEGAFCPYCGMALSQVNETMGKQDNHNPQDTQRSNVLSRIFAFRIAIVIGSIMCVGGLFLPFIKVTVFGTVVEKSFTQLVASHNYMLFIGIAIIGFLGAAFEAFSVSAVSGLLYGILLYLSTHSYFQEMQGEQKGFFIVKGIGYYCVWIGLLVMLIFAILGAVVKYKERIKSPRGRSLLALIILIICVVSGVLTYGVINHRNIKNANDASKADVDSSQSNNEQVESNELPEKEETLHDNDVKPEVRIFDFVNVLNNSEKERLSTYIDEVEKIAEVDIIIVTINREIGNSDEEWNQSMMELADDFYDRNHFGDDIDSFACLLHP